MVLHSYNYVRTLTAGHKTFGCQWFFEHSTPLKLLRSVDKNVARTPKRFHTGNTLANIKHDRYTNKIVIIIILLGSFRLSAQDSLIKDINIDTIQKEFKISNDEISTDTLVIINKVIIEQEPMNRFWDRILPLIGILIASLTLIYVRMNHKIDKIYGGWSNWKSI